MADYRLDCCGGYPSHRSGCQSEQRIQERQREYRETNEKKDRAWNDFFSAMSDEELFSYTEKAWDEVAKAQRWEERRRRALAYMRLNYKSQKFLEWRKNK